MQVRRNEGAHRERVLNDGHRAAGVLAPQLEHHPVRAHVARPALAWADNSQRVGGSGFTHALTFSTACAPPWRRGCRPQPVQSFATSVGTPGWIDGRGHDGRVNRAWASKSHQSKLNKWRTNWSL